MNEVQTWLVGWFLENTDLRHTNGDPPLQIDYFQNALLDSFAVIGLIGAIEDRFGIQFTDRHFQDRRFSTVGGLAELIGELREGGQREDGPAPEAGRAA